MTLTNGLHRVGAAAFRHPIRVLAAWVVILATLGGLAAHFYEPASASISIPGTPAQSAIDEAQRLFPNSGGGNGYVVFHALNGTSIADERTAITGVIDAVGKVDGITGAVSPFTNSMFVSSDGTIAYAPVTLEHSAQETAPATFSGVDKAVAAGRSGDLEVETEGDLISQAPGELLGAGEGVGLLIALAVLILTLGSLVAAGMPLVSALLAVGVSMAGLFALSRVVTINSTTPVLAVMLGLAVGIDYALFIINKYRGYVISGMERPAACARALATAGNAVVFAASTVVIALAALSVVNIPFMTTMGLVGAASIAVSALVALTITPAFLGLFGRFVFGRRMRSRINAKIGVGQVDERTIWYRWGKAVTAHPVPVLLVSIVVIAAIAWPARALQLGLPTDQYAAPDSTGRKAYDLLSRGFGVGFNGPLTVVVTGLPKVSDADRNAIRTPALAQYNAQVAAATAQAQAQYAQALAQATTPAARAALEQQAATGRAQAAKQEVTAMAQINASVAQYAKYVELQKVATKIGTLADVHMTTPALVTSDGTAGIIQVIPKSAPAASATQDLIANLRSSATQEAVAGGSARYGVTGRVALQEDINSKLAAALPVYLLVVVGLSFLILIVAFRSLLVPLKATLGFLLSVLAMFGAMVAVFQWGWFGITDAPGPIVSFIPIIAIGILFGLAMDYEFFLVSSMHEAFTETGDARTAVRHGFGAASKVVTAAAVIMASVFGGFISNGDATIQSIGFGLAAGIAVDAFIVRLTIVPAVLTLLGRSAWWLPRWLGRILPHLSIEGASETS